MLLVMSDTSYMLNTKTIGVRCSEDAHQRFRAAAFEEELTLGQMLEQLLDARDHALGRKPGQVLVKTLGR
jgi:hypothetical protein